MNLIGREAVLFCRLGLWASGHTNAACIWAQKRTFAQLRCLLLPLKWTLIQLHPDWFSSNYRCNFWKTKQNRKTWLSQEKKEWKTTTPSILISNTHSQSWESVFGKWEAWGWTGTHFWEITHFIRSQPKRTGTIAEFIFQVIPASGTGASHAL